MSPLGCLAPIIGSQYALKLSCRTSRRKTGGGGGKEKKKRSEAIGSILGAFLIVAKIGLGGAICFSWTHCCENTKTSIFRCTLPTAMWEGVRKGGEQISLATPPGSAHPHPIPHPNTHPHPYTHPPHTASWL